MSNRFFQQVSAAKPTLARVANITMLQRLGLAGGLQVCLDAGDASSYTSGQSWLDRSGNGQDFFLGADGSATATDPTFNGVAGALSSAEYFSVDGGDYFRYDTSNPSWVDAMHKDNALFSFACWAMPQGAAANGLFGTPGNNASNIGVQFLVNPANGNVTFQVANGTGSLALNAATNLGGVAGAWQFFALSVNEAGNVIRYRNGTSASSSGAYTSPSAAAATNVLEIGAMGNGQAPIANTGRIAQAMFWGGVALSLANLNAIFNATRGRYGV